MNDRRRIDDHDAEVREIVHSVIPGNGNLHPVHADVIVQRRSGYEAGGRVAAQPPGIGTQAPREYVTRAGFGFDLVVHIVPVVLTGRGNILCRYPENHVLGHLPSEEWMGDTVQDAPRPRQVPACSGIGFLRHHLGSGLSGPSVAHGRSCGINVPEAALDASGRTGSQ